jgi:hypothetical protein
MKMCGGPTNQGRSKYDIAATPLDDNGYMNKKLFNKDINVHINKPVKKGIYT